METKDLRLDMANIIRNLIYVGTLPTFIQFIAIMKHDN